MGRQLPSRACALLFVSVLTASALPADAQDVEVHRAFLPLAMQNVGLVDIPTPVEPTDTATSTHTPTSTLTPSMTPRPTITLTLSRTPSPTLSPTPTITPTATLTPTSTLTPTPPPANFRIGFLKCDSRREYVRIDNVGGTSGNLSRWTILSVVGSQRFRFPSHVLAPGETAYAYSGPDAPPTSGSSFRWTTAYIWNNDSDEARLITPSGDTVDTDDC